MSGIAGLIDLKGGAVDTGLLETMTAFLSWRGPDTQGVWAQGSVGLGHSLLGTVFDSELDKQPRTLDQRVWITADARIDSREELIGKIAPADEGNLKQATDAELIIHAYRRWGENCVDHLIGDFSFALWDSPEGRLLCARDHFGVKPFFYAVTGETLLFSNSLDCLLLNPDIPGEPDEEFIADFLLFSHSQRRSATAYTGVSRLPPAHTLSWSAQDGIVVNPYWEQPVPELIRYRDENEYVEHFTELLNAAVGDRLRTDKAGVFMSGGLDSTSVAAAAREVMPLQCEAWDLRACTFVYEHLIPDDEGEYSKEAAAALDIPVFHIPVDDEEIRLSTATGGYLPPEPSAEPVTGLSATRALACLPDFRVGLTGQGGDPALHPATYHPGRFVRSLLLGKLSYDILRYIVTHRRFPRTDIRKSLRKWLGTGEREQKPPIPPWLNPDFAEKMDITARWELQGAPAVPVDSLRSEAYNYIKAPMWADLFESYDAGFSGYPVELRHPFFDLRLISFLLALPAVPWCVEKELLRRALRGKIPEPVVSRPKAPLSGSPLFEILRREEKLNLERIAGTPQLERFVDIGRFLYIAEQPEKLRPGEYELITRPIGLALWLARPRPAG